ncbi:MAG: SDR family oxidoreductase [Pseudomonadota bacterium]|nr:SDR family oxidoreductase [Pseudomonadota bacterium]
MRKLHSDFELSHLGRREFMTAAAGMAATAFATHEAGAAGHVSAPVELSPEDQVTKPISAGSRILITGANRGLGFEFARQYAKLDTRIIATCRSPSKAVALQELAKNNSGIVIEKLDVTDLENIDELAEKYAGEPIDLLLNNAGIGGGAENQIFGKLNYPVFYEVMAVNVVGPIKMCEAFRKHVEASDLKKMVTVSSSQGSIAEVTMPMLYWYRSSKAAVNMQMVNLALQVRRKKVIVGLVTPGATATDFIPEPFRSRIPSIRQPEIAAADMIRNIDRFTLENSGTYFNYDGTVLPW